MTNLNHARFELLRELASESDRQETVFERRTFDLNVICEVEAPLEGTARNAAVQIFDIVRAFAHFATHNQTTRLRDDFKIIFRKAGQRDDDLISVIAAFLDVVGGISEIAI